MTLPIILNPNSILRAKAQEVQKEDIATPFFQQLILNMIETMVKKNGIGLAAPQVNQSVQLLCIDAKEFNTRTNMEPIDKDLLCDKNNYPALVLINPLITWKSFRKVSIEEGCLSIPGIEGKVKRPRSIKVMGLNMAGEKVHFKAEGLLARVLQHEIDHLHGVLFIDRL